MPSRGRDHRRRVSAESEIQLPREPSEDDIFAIVQILLEGSDPAAATDRRQVRQAVEDALREAREGYLAFARSHGIKAFKAKLRAVAREARRLAEALSQRKPGRIVAIADRFVAAFHRLDSQAHDVLEKAVRERADPTIPGPDGTVPSPSPLATFALPIFSFAGDHLFSREQSGELAEIREGFRMLWAGWIGPPDTHPLAELAMIADRVAASIDAFAKFQHRPSTGGFGGFAKFGASPHSWMVYLAASLLADTAGRADDVTGTRTGALHQLCCAFHDALLAEGEREFWLFEHIRVVVPRWRVWRAAGSPPDPSPEFAKMVEARPVSKRSPSGTMDAPHYRSG